MAEYELWLTDSRGLRITDQDGNSPLMRTSKFTANRTANEIGTFSMILPADIPQMLIRDDNMVQIWRQPIGGTMKLWRPYFIRKREWYYEDGAEVVEISGPDCNDILRRRNVSSRPGTADITELLYEVDAFMKNVVTDAFRDYANPLPDYGTRTNSRLNVQRLSYDGPIAHLSFPWEKLLTTNGGGIIGKLAEISESEGVRVFFDVKPVGVTSKTIEFEFRTYVGQPGRDLTQHVLFSIDQGNMHDPHMIEDATEEENYIYAYGQGEELDQYVSQVYDRDRNAQSVWGRIEGVVDASNLDDDMVEYAAESELAARKAKKSFYANPVSNEKTVFGIDWDFGDRVLARYHGDFEAIVSSVTLTVEDGQESIDARLEGEV